MPRSRAAAPVPFGRYRWEAQSVALERFGESEDLVKSDDRATRVQVLGFTRTLGDVWSCSSPISSWNLSRCVFIPAVWVGDLTTRGRYAFRQLRWPNLRGPPTSTFRPENTSISVPRFSSAGELCSWSSGTDSRHFGPIPPLRSLLIQH